MGTTVQFKDTMQSGGVVPTGMNEQCQVSSVAASENVSDFVVQAAPSIIFTNGADPTYPNVEVSNAQNGPVLLRGNQVEFLDALVGDELYANITQNGTGYAQFASNDANTLGLWLQGEDNIYRATTGNHKFDGGPLLFRSANGATNYLTFTAGAVASWNVAATVTTFSIQYNSFDLITIAGGGTMGFFSSPPTAKPTGVAVTAAAIHAALVLLGLIGP